MQRTTDALHLGVQTEECDLEHSSFLCSPLAESRPSIVVRSLLCDCVLRSNVLHLRAPNQLHPPCVFNPMFPQSANCLSLFCAFNHPRMRFHVLLCPFMFFFLNQLFVFSLCLWSIVAFACWILFASLSFLAYILTAYLSTNQTNTFKTLGQRCTGVKTVISKAVLVNMKKAEQCKMLVKRLCGGSRAWLLSRGTKPQQAFYYKLI